MRPDVVIDHEDYIGNRAYRRKVHAAMRRFAEECRPGRLEVQHGGGCCRLQPWPVTMQRIVRALTDDGLRTLGIVLDREGAA